MALQCVNIFIYIPHPIFFSVYEYVYTMQSPSGNRKWKGKPANWKVLMASLSSRKVIHAFSVGNFPLQKQNGGNCGRCLYPGSLEPGSWPGYQKMKEESVSNTTKER